MYSPKLLRSIDLQACIAKKASWKTRFWEQLFLMCSSVPNSARILFCQPIRYLKVRHRRLAANLRERLGLQIEVPVAQEDGFIVRNDRDDHEGVLANVDTIFLLEDLGLSESDRKKQQPNANLAHYAPRSFSK